MVLQLIEGFDPEESFIDRRIFYEVTGKRLIAGEFLDEDTSGEEEDDRAGVGRGRGRGRGRERWAMKGV